MSPDAIFSAASSTALAGWLVLLASPLIPVWSDRIAGVLLPVALSLVYCGLILAHWFEGKGDFGSLDGVAALFQSRGLLLAGWVHYLAFDLFAGSVLARRARRERVPFWLVVPCLAATFLFGPAGFLAFHAVRLVAARTASTNARP